MKVATERYFAMKADNAVGPYQQIQESTEFTFEFFHSNPNVAESLVRQLIDVERTSVRYHHRTSDPINKSVRKMLQTITEILTLDSFQSLHVHKLPLSSPMKCSVKEPLLIQHGVAVLTDYGMYFQPTNGMASVSVSDNNNRGTSKPHMFLSIHDVKAYLKIRQVTRRRRGIPPRLQSSFESASVSKNVEISPICALMFWPRG